MAKAICYLNSDLDLTSSEDLLDLAGEFKSHGLFALNASRGEDGLWYATFEVLDQSAEPEPNIAAMVTIIESLVEPHRSTWLRCSRREFNIGYDCGAEPWAFNQGLSCELLSRIAEAGVSLRWTLYPNREEATGPPL
jgi:hypothetical protein